MQKESLKPVKKTIEDYLNALFENVPKSVTEYKLLSHKFQMYLTQQRKADDDKRYLLNDQMHKTLAWGHYRLKG